ncbi:trehalose-phosphatase [Acidicapsa ligni]|uniref:trehalose-phosphatase n=1 Tax=Acidicapsa ligni TaxID=542300 RepID=UPI0021DFD3A1|nr:trehalose-phosphatase [Acidicapsa ligni]
MPRDEARLDDFFSTLAKARESALLLDFDGTLAPFRIDRFQARPWAGVTELLEKIQKEGRTRLALVTGRPASEAASLLGMKQPIEVWGLHGAERLYADGHVEQEVLAESEIYVLREAKKAVYEADLGLLIEDKWNAVVVHWRGIAPQSVPAIREHVVSLLRPYATDERIQMLQFDGGVELRTGRDKGGAVLQVLAGLSESAPVAYLGDDTTDEYAFRALAGRGLGVLVRKIARPTAAQVWLKPPGQLRKFLKSWLTAMNG